MNQLLYFILGIIATLVYQGTLELAFAQVTDIKQVTTEQDYVFKLTGHYAQIKTSESLPYSVNVYETPNGKGYQIVTEHPGHIQYQAYGIDSESFTYLEPKINLPSSSSSNPRL